jgi:hypothetical protein
MTFPGNAPSTDTIRERDEEHRRVVDADAAMLDAGRRAPKARRSILRRIRDLLRRRP